MPNPGKRPLQRRWWFLRCRRETWTARRRFRPGVKKNSEKDCLPARYYNSVEQFALEFDSGPQRRIFTVSELNAAVREVLESEFQDIWVSGEISGTTLAASGHYYFSLKERDAQVRSVAFRSAHRYWKIKPQDGLRCWRGGGWMCTKPAARTSCWWRHSSQKAWVRCSWRSSSSKKSSQPKDCSPWNERGPCRACLGGSASSPRRAGLRLQI